MKRVSLLTLSAFVCGSAAFSEEAPTPEDFATCVQQHTALAGIPVAIDGDFGPGSASAAAKYNIYYGMPTLTRDSDAEELATWCNKASWGNGDIKYGAWRVTKPSGFELPIEIKGIDFGDVRVEITTAHGSFYAADKDGHINRFTTTGSVEAAVVMPMGSAQLCVRHIGEGNRGLPLDYKISYVDPAKSPDVIVNAGIDADQCFNLRGRPTGLLVQRGGTM
jgi:hypothetical protein